MFYASKKSRKIWDGNVDGIVISKLVTTKTKAALTLSDLYDTTCMIQLV